MKPLIRPLLTSLVCLWLVAFAGSFGISTFKQIQAKMKQPVAPARNLRVLTIGGSVAHGWKAPQGKGYLQLAFNQLSNNTAADYKVYDRTIVGANGTQLATIYKGRYETWLNGVQPDVVVISWGLLNDAHPNTPLNTFQTYMKQEIQQALAHHAVVFVVTPPVTKASYTQFKVQEAAYAEAEVTAAESLHNPNVYVFHVFSEMKQYLADHQQTYVPYMGDGWHPNAAGHQLAGQLLYDDMVKQFGNQPIAFQSV